MAVVGTSYSDWMRQNPQIVEQAGARVAPPPVANQSANAGQIAPAAPQPNSYTISAQLQDRKETTGGKPLNEGVPMGQAPAQQQPSQVGQYMQAVGGMGGQAGSAMGQVNPPADTGQHGMEGIAGIAKTIASFYTGGLAGGAMSLGGGR